jgi:hypothetical protein
MPGIKVWSLDEVKSIIFQHEYKQIEIFNHVLTKIKTSIPTMIELGAAEGLYSLMFSEFFEHKKQPYINICLELCDHKIREINKNLPTAITHHGYLGDLDMEDGDVQNILANQSLTSLHKYTLSEILKINNLLSVDILHVDIQGSELELVEELETEQLFNKVRFYFISTHHLATRSTHEKVVEYFSKFSGTSIILNDPIQNNGGGLGDSLLIVENTEF